MQRIIVFCTFSVCLWNYVNALNLPGPLVYVVTPSPRPPHGDEGRSAPFYYHNWKRRMDAPRNTTTPMMSKTPKTKTPDLIFAEFESDNNNNMKSIRKLLEKEKIEPKTTTTTTTTTSRPIYVPEEQMATMAYHVNYGLPMEKDEEKKIDMTDYYALYNNMYENNENLPAPVYSPSAKPNSAQTPLTTTTTKTTTTITPAPMNVENIWHIIDSQKVSQPPGPWEEEPITSENSPDTLGETSQQEDEKSQKNEDYPAIDENFALPGFSTISGNGAENESRAIRTELNMRFPYVNLKPFQIKKPLLNGLSNSKKTTNMFTNVDSFQEVKNPVRGEAQDYVPMRQPIDRYNPAQPYLPPTDYGSKSKQSSPNSSPVKTVANLVPPPPPPTPKLTDENFPSPSSYESFPPYASSGPDSSPTLPSPPPSPKPSPPRYQPPVDTSNDSDLDSSPPSDSGGPSIDLGYNYKPPLPPAQHFVPTLPPLTKPFYSYSYNKPPMTVDSPPMMDMEDKPDFNGYQYSKPALPSPPSNHPSISYGHHDAPDSHSHHNEDSDYPELIFNKPYGGMSDTKGGDDMKVTEGIGMVPPPAPPTDMDSPGPSDDHGFPHDFPGDFKYHHDFDDHDEYHHHHHHTTTTTTETPRVNRYSYYYLGKKLYYLPLYFSVYFIVYVGALIIKAVLRHKIVYPNSWRPNEQTAGFFSKRSVDSWNLSNDNLHEITGKVTHAIATAANKYISGKEE